MVFLKDFNNLKGQKASICVFARYAHIFSFFSEPSYCKCFHLLLHILYMYRLLFTLFICVFAPYAHIIFSQNLLKCFHLLLHIFYM